MIGCSFGFALLRSVIGPKSPRQLLNQSGLRLNPTAPWSHAFSRASVSLLVYTIVLIGYLMILWIYDAHSEHCPLTKLKVIDRILLVCSQESNPLSDRSSACSDKLFHFSCLNIQDQCCYPS